MKPTLSASPSNRFFVPAILVLILAGASAAQAQTGAGLLLKPAPTSQPFEISVDGAFLAKGHTKETDQDFRLGFYESAGRYRLNPAQPLAPAAGYQVTYLDIHSPILPSRLVDMSLGFGMAVGKFEPWWMAASVGVGYAGTSPFNDPDAWYAKADLMFGREVGKGNILLVVLDYDGNRTILPDVPLPGIAYKSQFSPTLTYVAGIPFSSVTWKPIDKLTIEAQYTIPATITATVTYEVVKSLSIYGAYDNREGAFHIKGAPDTRRLFFEQNRVELGAQWSPLQSMEIRVGVGYAFAQEFSTGFDRRSLNTVAKVSDEPYVRLAMQFSR